MSATVTGRGVSRSGGVSVASWHGGDINGGSGNDIMVWAVVGEGIAIEHSAMHQNAHNYLKSVARRQFLGERQQIRSQRAVSVNFHKYR